MIKGYKPLTAKKNWEFYNTNLSLSGFFFFFFVTCFVAQSCGFILIQSVRITINTHLLTNSRFPFFYLTQHKTLHLNATQLNKKYLHNTKIHTFGYDWVCSAAQVHKISMYKGRGNHCIKYSAYVLSHSSIIISHICICFIYELLKGGLVVK